jgi:predicted NACHT family NTPase
MQKIVCTHAATQTPDIQMEEDGTSAVLPIPLLPLFMRAAELSKLLSETGKDAADLSEYLCDTGKENMRYLVELFLDKSARQELFPVHVKNCILELFDNDHVLVCIDGLDEAAPYQDLVEDIIDKHVAEKCSDGDVRMLISTREHSYVNSRNLRRLEYFDVVKLQPLGKDQQVDMIKGRLIQGKQETFLQQLAGIADKNPELATSPFLLSLMIEVYKNDGSIPSQRVKLYAKQVKAIVLRCIATRTNPVALEVATDYLEILAFVCQVKRSQRDFSLAACADDVKELWKHTQDDLDLARECLCGTNMVGLLTRVVEDIYRFSHLTLQEYLAATCAVRLFGLDAQELLNQL